MGDPVVKKIKALIVTKARLRGQEPMVREATLVATGPGDNLFGFGFAFVRVTLVPNS